MFWGDPFHFPFPVFWANLDADCAAEFLFLEVAGPCAVYLGLLDRGREKVPCLLWVSCWNQSRNWWFTTLGVRQYLKIWRWKILDLEERFAVRFLHLEFAPYFRPFICPFNLSRKTRLCTILHHDGTRAQTFNSKPYVVLVGMVMFFNSMNLDNNHGGRHFGSRFLIFFASETWSFGLTSLISAV